jgi:hypothetical protein
MRQIVFGIQLVMAGLAILLGPGFGAEPAPSAVKAAKAAPRPPLRVCLVSGANDSKPYATDTTLKELADYLRQEDRMVCEVVVMNPAGTGFVSLERLLAADAAIFFVRRKTPDAAQLAILRQFFASGKGFIALRSTSHAWDNWRDFDVEVLGARLFHVALGYAEAVAMPGYRRMVRNALYWVTKTPVPVDRPAAKKTED